MANTMQSVFKREAREVKHYRILRKIVGAGIVAIATLLMVVYVVTLLYSDYGSFTVTTKKLDSYKYSITLSEDPSFIESVGQLNCNASKEITNISVRSLPLDVDSVNGNHGGVNYLAYTFYCKNNGQYTVDYSYELFISNITQELDKAVRVRLYVDGEPTTYARAASDGSGAEPDTVAFQTGNTVVKKTVKNLHPEDIVKFTVVIWIEGDDPDCTDDKIGGEFKLGMGIEILGVSEETGVTEP